MSGVENIKVSRYNNFDVYEFEKDHTFIFADFPNKGSFLEGLSEFVLSEDNLLNYAKRTSKINFSPTVKNYKRLYDNIGIFLNAELETLSVNDLSQELVNVLGEEYDLFNVDGELTIQNDKIGKIGEYIFHILLTQYFRLECVIPKFKCITDRNMSVFGIDSLFFDSESKRIYFGESKFSKRINNGITLVNKSLVDYEDQIREEYRIVLSSEETFIKSDKFEELFREDMDISISFEDFIDIAGVSSIGVPIFIAHGEDESKGPEYYLKRLKKGIHRNQLFSMETIYIGISFPVIDKAEFIECIITKAVKKSNEYRREILRLR